jgi:hypothetical protein
MAEVLVEGFAALCSRYPYSSRGTAVEARVEMQVIFVAAAGYDTSTWSCSVSVCKERWVGMSKRLPRTSVGSRPVSRRKA